MEDQDKTYFWLVIICFLGLAAAICFASFELMELKADNLFTPTPIF